ncbi:MAG: DNA alkylation repair protein [Rhizobiaceae bacterium]|nr:DNA alkylation repair protein [Rhizobiaceae bacterium]
MAAKKLKEWFDRDCALRIGKAISENAPDFDAIEYADTVSRPLEHMELKDRVLLLASELHNRLPEDYLKTAEIILSSLGPELKEETGMFTEGYWLMPIARLVEEFGLSNFDVSMHLCEEITKRHTSEYAVRPFIEQDQERALQIITRWVQSKNAHVRRLASEGVRPRLPWAKKLECFIQNPKPILELVAPLRADTSHYVRKSVANLVNDISKDHPVLIENLACDWKQEGNKYTDWIVHHGTRTLRKQVNAKGKNV